MEYILLSRPLKGQHNETTGSITVGQDISKIPPDEYGNGFDGGPFPSRTLETYTRELVEHAGKEWYRETLPVSKESAIKSLKDRLGIKSKTNFTLNVGQTYCNLEEDWRYAVVEA